MVITKRINVNGYATVDKGVADFLKKMNSMGLVTVASCSGLKEDHPNEGLQPPYVCFEVHKESFFAGDPLDFPPEATSPRAHEIANAIEEAGWFPNFGKYLLGTPVVCAYPDVNPGAFEWKVFGKHASDFGNLKPREKEIVKKLDDCQAFWRKALTDEIMRRKWKELEDGMTKQFNFHNP